MAATRTYRRNNAGQFAGASGGSKMTVGKSGGFANSAFRTRVAQSRMGGQSRPVGSGTRSNRRARAGKIALRLAQNKHIQKAAVHGVVALGVVHVLGGESKGIHVSGIAKTLRASTVKIAAGKSGGSKVNSKLNSRGFVVNPLR